LETGNFTSNEICKDFRMGIYHFAAGKFIISNFKFHSMIALTNLDVYKLSEQLSDMIWNDYDHWPEKVKRTIGFQIIIVREDRK